MSSIDSVLFKYYYNTILRVTIVSIGVQIREGCRRTIQPYTYDEKFALNDNKLLGEAQVAVGNVFDSTAPTKRVTVPFPLRISEIMGPYTERDRKLYVFLLHAAHTCSSQQ